MYILEHDLLKFRATVGVGEKHGRFGADSLYSTLLPQTGMFEDWGQIYFVIYSFVVLFMLSA